MVVLTLTFELTLPLPEMKGPLILSGKRSWDSRERTPWGIVIKRFIDNIALNSANLGRLVSLKGLNSR